MRRASPTRLRARVVCPLRLRRILPVMIAFEGDVVVVIESERQRSTETVGVDDSLSRELVRHVLSSGHSRRSVALACLIRISDLGLVNDEAHTRDERHVLSSGHSRRSVALACLIRIWRRHPHSWYRSAGTGGAAADAPPGTRINSNVSLCFSKCALS